MASPAHQTANVDRSWSVPTAPNSRRVSVPQVALANMDPRAPRNTMATASRSRPSSVRNPAFVRSKTATIGARVLPAAIIAAAAGEGPSGRFTRNAATAIPGQTR
jgi:hypothetical protein